MSKCKCRKKVISNSAINTCGDMCNDVCVNPRCGDPDFLSVLAPVIFDEIGINVCRSISLGTLLTQFPTTAYVSAEVIDITYTIGEGTTPITITQIPSRPNCYEITLTNLTVYFVIKLYDCCKRLLNTSVISALYLPVATDESFDADTNPSEVTIELFAPYGISYTDNTATTPDLNVLSFISANSSINQGLNLMAIPKVLELDTTNATITVGITFVVSSVYAIPYQLPHNGKSVISKGELNSGDDSVCINFVNGCLLDRNIKPLELECPLDSKKSCETDADINPCNDTHESIMEIFK